VRHLCDEMGEGGELLPPSQFARSVPRSLREGVMNGVLDFEKLIEIQARVELGIQDSALREAQEGNWSVLAGHIRHHPSDASISS
jgi:hypothetical protein